MSDARTIGIVGAYGSLGEIVAAELAARTDVPLLLGGRDASKAEALAARLGPRCSAQRVDVQDPGSLRAFTERCHITISMASPSMYVVDRIAQAVLQTGGHYIDPSGPMHFGHDLIAPHHDELVRGDRVFVFSTGWMPGTIELMARLAAQRLEVLDEVRIYVIDRSEWSAATSIDIVSMLRCYNEGDYRNGGFVPRSPWHTELYEFPPPFGKRRVAAKEHPEIERFARQSGARRVAVYYPADLKVLLFTAAIRLLPSRQPGSRARTLSGYEDKAAAVMRPAVRADVRRHGGPASMAVAEVSGRAKGRAAAYRVVLPIVGARQSWFSAIPSVIAACMLLDGRLTFRGCAYFSDAVDPEVYMTELAAAGGGFEVREV
jgi:hypothetical protein